MKPLNKMNLLAISIGVVYIWFGTLKFFPGLSPAEELAKSTIHQLTYGLIPDEISIILLAIFEVGIGLLMVTVRFKCLGARIALGHMACTFLPLLFFPDQSFNGQPIYLTIIGQYIIKNLIIVVALLMLFERKKTPSTAAIEA